MSTTIAASTVAIINGRTRRQRRRHRPRVQGSIATPQRVAQRQQQKVAASRATLSAGRGRGLRRHPRR